MQMPDFLPDKLKFYESFDHDESLFQALTLQPHDMALFFEVSCSHESWSLNHPILIRSILRFAAKHYYLGYLSEEIAQKIVKTIQTHSSLVQPFLLFRPSLFHTIRLNVEGQGILVNSLLFGASSPFFKNLFSNCFDKLSDEWTLPKTRLSIFRLIENYIVKGSISDLWRHEKQEIEELMAQAHAWHLTELEGQCAECLKRYLTRDNILDTIIEAHRKSYYPWKNIAYTFFNNLEYGLRLVLESESDLKVEVLDYKLDTFILFNTLAPWLTHLAFADDLSQQVEFRTWVAACPKLIGVDLGGSSSYSNQFSVLPHHLAELDLSACAWINVQLLRQASSLFPNLRKLNLASNTHLNFQAFAELNRFHQLVALNLSRCHQINDEDLKLIGRGATHLMELNLEECRLITNKGIAELLILSPGIIILNISRSILLTDKALSEIAIRGSLITHLNLMYSKGYTDQGLLLFLKLRPNLTYLNIKGCDFSLKTIAKIQDEYPFLTLEV